jgi:hypothetical protein
MNILWLMAAMRMNLSRKPKKTYFRFRLKECMKLFKQKGGVK